MRDLRRFELFVAAAALCLIASARPASAKCFDAPFTASDASDIAEVRRVIDTFCDCSLFPGDTPETKHGKYVKCAKGIIVAKAKVSKLRNECKGAVTKIYAKSSCGFASTPQGDKVPCVKKMISTGKVTCAAKPLNTCTSKPGVYTQNACGDNYTCTDAGDSNGNLVLDPADSGACVNARGPVVGTTRLIPSGAEAPHTPGSASVVVTNPKLLVQFGAAVNLNNAMYTRYRYSHLSGGPDAILVLIPGFAGGATGFKILAENLIERTRVDEGLNLEVWAVDRRTNQLEDLAGLQIAEIEEDPFVATDWLFGQQLGFTTLSKSLRTGPAAPNRRAFFYDARLDTAFMASWTNLVFSRDIDAVVEAARAAVDNNNVFLGGHSAGTGFTARYASTDFNLTGVGPAQPGYAKLRGLVLLEGGGGSTAGAGAITADSLDRMEAKANGGLYAAIVANGPRCADGITPCTIATEAVDCASSTPPKCTDKTSTYTTGLGGLPFTPQLLATVEVAGIQAINDLNGTQTLLQVDQAGPNTSAIDLVPEIGLLSIFLPDSNTAGAIGNFLDDDATPAAAGAFFVATSLGAPGPVVAGLGTWYDIDNSASFPPCPGAGCVTPDNGPMPTTLPAADWGVEKEVTRMDRMAKALADGGSNFTDWYYPQAGPSTTSVSGVCSGLAGTCTVGNVGAACSGGTQSAANAQCSQAINLDSTALSITRGRRDIENLTQAANIDIPVIAFGGSNGLAPVTGSFIPFATSIGTCAAPSCSGLTPRVVDAVTPNPAFPTYGNVAGGFEAYISEGYGHVDALTAEDDSNNNIVGPLAAFIGRNVIP